MQLQSSSKEKTDFAGERPVDEENVETRKN